MLTCIHQWAWGRKTTHGWVLYCLKCGEVDLL